MSNLRVKVFSPGVRSISRCVQPISMKTTLLLSPKIGGDCRASSSPALKNSYFTDDIFLIYSKGNARQIIVISVNK